MTAMIEMLTADPARVLAAVLALVALIGMARLALRQWRAPAPRRARAWRFALLLIAQPLLAALLYFTLLPPARPGGADTLVVATAAATPQAWAAAGGSVRVALPEAPALPGVERVPDLATALRRHPGVRRVHVVGLGLEARDRDAAAALPLAFDAAPLPRGLVELHAPEAAVAGSAFTVEGRVHGVPGGTVELRDPGGRPVDRIRLPADGRFALSALTRVPGGARFALHVRDASGKAVESTPVPLRVEPASPPRLLVLAGAPGPEVKFLRRWARDAGLPIHTQIDVGGSVQLGDAPVRLDAAALARFDAVVLDERAWSALGEAQRTALTTAVRGGLGLVLRVTAALGDAERRRLRALGFTVDAGRDSEPVRLQPPARDEQAVRARLGPGTREAPRTSDAPLPELPMLTRRAMRVDAADGIALNSAAAGITPALWRAERRGRIAVWTLTDSYALVLAGRDDLHGALWSDAVATVARPRAQRPFVLEGEPREGESLALCGLAGEASVARPDGKATPLQVDPASGTQRCAAFWPAQAGWHALQAGGAAQWFHVRAAADAPGLHANRLREGTLRLRSNSRADARSNTHGLPAQRGARWPWWLAWCLVAAATWWLERSRRGRAAQHG